MRLNGIKHETDGQHDYPADHGSNQDGDGMRQRMQPQRRNEVLTAEHAAEK
jgi:hypothetical protein